MIAWWCHSGDLRVASTRIRGEQVVRLLRDQGLAARRLTQPPGDAVLDALVLSKRYDSATMGVASKLRSRGTRVVLDLCDNRFVSSADPEPPIIAQERAALTAALREVDHLVLSTQTLLDTLGNLIPSGLPTTVIGDLDDDLSLVPQSFRSGLSSWQQRRRARHLYAAKASGGPIHIVWFGSHGGPYAEAGMEDLARISPHLLECHKTTPIIMTVISNSLEKYQRVSAHWPCRSEYFDWSAASFEAIMAHQDITVVPITRNAFSICKTDNRLVTATRCGTAVCATAIPSYEPYRDAVFLDQWDEGLACLTSSAKVREARVSHANRLARESTDPHKIAGAWTTTLNG